MNIAAVILAGGASSRMGSPKALLDWHGESVLSRLEHLFARHADQNIVVMGHDLRVVPEISEGVWNPDAGRGMLSSLQCGLRCVRQGLAGAIFLPVDYPAVLETSVMALAAGYAANPAAAFVVPRHRDRHGHPVLIARRMFADLLALDARAQARDLIRSRRPETTYIDVDDEGVLTDIDTPSDYEAAVRRWPQIGVAR